MLEWSVILTNTYYSAQIRIHFCEQRGAMSLTLSFCNPKDCSYAIFGRIWRYHGVGEDRESLEHASWCCPRRKPIKLSVRSSSSRRTLEMFEVQGLQHSIAVVILQLCLFAPEAPFFSMQFWCSATSTRAAVLHCARHLWEQWCDLGFLSFE